MIALIPSMPQNFDPTADELAEMKQGLAMGIEQIEQMMVEQIYENASSGRATLDVRNARDEAGNIYSNMSLMVVGSYEQDDTRFCICGGGFAVNFDAMLDLMRELAERYA